jgi:hypothetical protein
VNRESVDWKGYMPATTTPFTAASRSRRGSRCSTRSQPRRSARIPRVLHMGELIPSGENAGAHLASGRTVSANGDVTAAPMAEASRICTEPASGSDVT